MVFNDLTNEPVDDCSDVIGIFPNVSELWVSFEQVTLGNPQPKPSWMAEDHIICTDESYGWECYSSLDQSPSFRNLAFPIALYGTEGGGATPTPGGATATPTSAHNIVITSHDGTPTQVPVLDLGWNNDSAATPRASVTPTATPNVGATLTAQAPGAWISEILSSQGSSPTPRLTRTPTPTATTAP